MPVFLGLNFNGNHAVTTDPGVLLPTLWRGERETKLYTPRRPLKSRAAAKPPAGNST